MDRFDFATLCRQPQRLGRNLQQAGGIGKIEPRFDAVAGRSEDRVR
jgi:hypothetical protein